MAGAPRRRLVVGLGVVGCHVALFVLLRGAVGGPDRHASQPEQPLTTLRLLPWRPAPPTKTEATTTAPQRVSRRPAPISVAVPPTTVAPPSPAAPTRADAAAPPAVPASEPPRALDLTLPRGWATRPDARQPAIDDPRGNSPRLTAEQRMSGAFDTRVIEEPMEDGRRRIRRGADCIILAPSRTAQLMPFNESAARTPSLVSACP